LNPADEVREEDDRYRSKRKVRLLQLERIEREKHRTGVDAFRQRNERERPVGDQRLCRRRCLEPPRPPERKRPKVAEARQRMACVPRHRPNGNDFEPLGERHVVRRLDEKTVSAGQCLRSGTMEDGQVGLVRLDIGIGGDVADENVPVQT